MTSGLLVELYFGPLISLRVEKESNTNTNPWNIHLRCPGLNSEFEEHCNSQKIQHNHKTKQNLQLCFMFYLLSSVSDRIFQWFDVILTNLVISPSTSLYQPCSRSLSANQITALLDRDSSSSSHTHRHVVEGWRHGSVGTFSGLVWQKLASLRYIHFLAHSGFNVGYSIFLHWDVLHIICRKVYWKPNKFSRE